MKFLMQWRQGATVCMRAVALAIILVVIQNLLQMIQTL